MEFASNNDLKPIEPAEEKRSVVKSEAKVVTNKKKTLANIFIEEDVKSVGKHLLTEVLVPALKKGILDLVYDGFSMLLYGSKAPGRPQIAGGKVNYGGYYTGQVTQRKPEEKRKRVFDYDTVVFQTKSDAEAVLTRMIETLNRYGLVRVADLYDYAELSYDFPAHDYGWKDIGDACTKRGLDGYIIDLPRPIPLK